MKKTFVLVVLFILPLVAYMFFASGVNNFGRLPTLTEDVQDLQAFSPQETLEGKITILGFLGYDLEMKKGNAFNLNQKIYKPFYEFRDFQMVMVLPKGSEEKVAELKKELSGLADIRNWKFVHGEDQDIKALFSSLKTNMELDEKLGSPYVFIIDKDRNLRGRSNDEDEGMKYGFDATSVADINNKMEDDVKVILAEYRLALKKNNAKRN
ncbi:hypothetical protein [Lentiprolixibacter aurantiacus]|uniref:Uncharacterized protein n=1 Tax=Lentiprolixibacter aurantiacus TaxID=2993939 RepID=A0AAE3MKC7_9FLAO|nr:hypothetical protein [Lentiprolixibacter aurantiacus]MCX2719043.1 hypothetical protein [Lentiprolixibacter aurantiacus]